MGNMNRIAWVSPYPPFRSGLSVYSEEMVDYLSSISDNVYIKVSPFVSSGQQYIGDINPDDFDRIVYNIGNHPSNSLIYSYALEYPGYVILHDINLHDLIIHRTYKRKSYLKYINLLLNEEACRNTIKHAVNMGIEQTVRKQFNMLKELACSGNRFIVHSRFALETLKDISNDIEAIHINHFSSWYDYNEPRFGSNTVIGIFGYISGERHLSTIIEGFNQFINDNNVNYKLLIVGSDTDNTLDTITESDNINIITDADDEEFLKYMRSVDAGIHLRYPGCGEMSGNLIKLMGYGKPVLVNREKAFAEIDPDAVFFTESSDMASGIMRFLSAIHHNPGLLKKTGLNAYNLIRREYSIENIAPVIDSCIDSQKAHRGSCSIEKHSIGEMVSIIGIKGLYNLMSRGLV